MGLFSFLSRRTGDNKSKSSASLKALPYDSSFSVETPTLDGYSVAGSNSYAEPPLSRGRSAFSQTVLTLDTASEDEQLPPTPRLPQFRDESVERPSTAPSDRPSSAAPSNDDPRVKRNGQKRPPPLSFRGPRTEITAPGPRPGSRGSISSITSVFRRTKGHSRVNSRQDPNKAFKDLLDAQSEINPAHSRARVQAAGARDYGEDVAERNMGQNGCDLGSEHVKAFYAQPRRTESENMAGTKKLDPYKAGVRRRSAHPSQYVLPAHAAAESPLMPNLKLSRKESVARRRSVSTYLPPGLGKIKFLPFDRTSAYLRDSSPRTPPLDAEKSDATTAAPESPKLVMPRVPKTTPAPTTRTTRLLRDSVELTKKRAEASVPEDSVADDSPASNFAAWSANRSRRSSAMLMPTSPPRRNHSLYTLRSSGSSLVSEETVHTTPLSPPKTAPGDQVQGAAESSTHCAAGSLDNGDASSPKFLPLLPVKGGGHTDVTSLGDQTLGFPPSIRTRSTRGWSASSGTPTACESSTAASISTSTFNNRPPSLHTADTSVDLSIGTASPKLKSARSFTRTCSTAHDSDSDSVSHYEDNKHTKITPFPPDTAAVGRAFSIEDYLSPEPNPNDSNTNEDATTTTTIPAATAASATDNFNIDDYLSSDAESLTAAANTTIKTTSHTHRRRPTAEGEEYLLFRDSGFGVGGQLPGLADPFPPASLPPSRSRVAKHRHSALTLPLAPLYGASGRRMSTGRWDWGSRDWDKEGTGVGRRRFILDTAADDETASESDEEEVMMGRQRNCNCNCDNATKLDVYDAGYEADYVEDECEGGARRRRRHHRKKRTRRLSALCRLEGREGAQDGLQLQEERQLEQGRTVEEEKKADDKVAAAVRLRKEVRRARRLAGQASVTVLRGKRSVN
ncbi:uncharacterized protein B0H64DRAFT_325203 [Chaetomium fimeti]|uniref:Uncharacterized protein n=1 Tax=Chaetomium fimeti TaxID=1854472 RepID=A0AAE0HE57_9PEZI|nr:hypothetical protein B0H64DRAFT_325203 [Chaetomium fimeti]